MKVNTEKAITPQASSDLTAPEPKINQETSSNSVAVTQNITNTGSKQIAQHGLSVMSLQATVTRTDLQKQFEENALQKNGKLDQAAADRFVQGNQLANDLTQKKPFDLGGQNGTENGNNSAQPWLNQNQVLPGLDNHSRNDQNLRSIFQDAMSGKAPSRQVGSTLIDGAKTPSHNLGEDNLLNGTDTPGFKQEVDPLSSKQLIDAWKSDAEVGANNVGTPSEQGSGAAKQAGPVIKVLYDIHGIKVTRDQSTGTVEVKGGKPYGKTDQTDPTKTFLKNDLDHEITIRRNADGTVRVGPTLKVALEEKAAREKTKKRPADDAPERSQGGTSEPITTPYHKLVDNEFTTFDSAGLDKYLRLAKGIQNIKVNPDPDGNTGSQGGPAPNEPIPGSGVVDPPDRPVQPNKGPIPVTGPIRKTPGGIPR
jgi:hypothetical protein